MRFNDTPNAIGCTMQSHICTRKKDTYVKERHTFDFRVHICIRRTHTCLSCAHVSCNHTLHTKSYFSSFIFCVCNTLLRTRDANMAHRHSEGIKRGYFGWKGQARKEAQEECRRKRRRLQNRRALCLLC